ncbi:MAG: hypothetical protein KME03_19240 [Aphanocapsa lilacina HA4352-LM1]|jgi:hypothetical protein|nr:hypothetical protein [Aphanocapsa lilacina HA4352-LM1]
MSYWKKIVSASFVWLFLASPGLAAVPTLTQQARDNLVETERFLVVRTVKEIPEVVQVQMANLLRQASLQLANPGQKLQKAGDDDPMVPQRRLIFAGISPDYCVVVYEQYAYSVKGIVGTVLVYSLAGNTARLVGGGVTRSDIGDLAQLKTAVKKGEIRPLARGYLP